MTTFGDSFATKGNVTVSYAADNTTSFYGANMYTTDHAVNDAPTWRVVDTYEAETNFTYVGSSIHPFYTIVANPALAVGIAQPKRLNQVAFLLNAITAGNTIAKGRHTMMNQTFTGCGAISAADIEAVIYALVRPAGTCDNPESLCTSDNASPNKCNVASMWTEAFAQVPDGSIYVVTTYTCGGPILPFVVVPSGSGGVVQLVAVDSGKQGARCVTCAT